MTDMHTLVERLTQTEPCFCQFTGKKLYAIYSNRDGPEAANRITALEAREAELVAHLCRMITAVTEFGPHCGFWDWRDDASAFLATLAKHHEGENA